MDNAESGCDMWSRVVWFIFLQSLAAVKRLQPKRALFVGMTHEFDHDLDNEHLKDWSKRQVDSKYWFLHLFEDNEHLRLDLSKLLNLL